MVQCKKPEGLRSQAHYKSAYRHTLPWALQPRKTDMYIGF